MVKSKADFCLRGVSEDGSVKLWLAQTTELCEEGRRRHDAWSVGAAALGRLLTAGVFFGQNLKNEKDNVTLRINGDGPLGSLAVVAEANGAVRGFVANPHVEMPRSADGNLLVGPAIGKGTLTVIKDMGFALSCIVLFIAFFDMWIGKKEFSFFKEKHDQRWFNCLALIPKSIAEQSWALNTYKSQ